jgi:hypothetical protein
MLKQVQNHQTQLYAAQLATKKLAREKNPHTSPQINKIDQNIQALLAQEGKLMKSIASLSKAEQERLRKLEEERKRKEEEERKRKLVSYFPFSRNIQLIKGRRRAKTKGGRRTPRTS